MMFRARHRAPTRRPGLSLVVVVVVMAIAAGLLSVLVAMNADMFRTLQRDRARSTLRSVSASAAAYAERHRDDLVTMPLDEPVTLDTSKFTGQGMSSQAEIRLVARDGGYGLEITTRVQRGRIAVEDVRDLAVELSP